MQPSLEGEKKMVDQLPLVTLLTFATAARTSARAMSSESSASSSLMSAKGGCLRPYVSLDAAWCFDFGVRGSGVGLNGTRFQC